VKSRLVRGRAHLKALLTKTAKTIDAASREGLDVSLGEGAQ
jgi:hypothetical protein